MLMRRVSGKFYGNGAMHFCPSPILTSASPISTCSHKAAWWKVKFWKEESMVSYMGKTTTPVLFWPQPTEDILQMFQTIGRRLNIDEKSLWIVLRKWSNELYPSPILTSASPSSSRSHSAVWRTAELWLEGSRVSSTCTTEDYYL